MDPPPSTADEKRFVLAEIVKSSTVDIETLIIFIQTNNISRLDANAASSRHLSIRPGALSTQSTSGQGEPASSHTGGTTTSPERDAPPVPRVTKTSLLMPKQFAPIAPRPLKGNSGSYDRDQSVSSRSGSQKPSRKRGRPSKADMAKRDLKPILPKPIAPRPPLQTDPQASSHPREITQTASSETTPATARPTSTEETEDTKRRRLTAPTY